MCVACYSVGFLESKGVIMSECKMCKGLVDDGGFCSKECHDTYFKEFL